MRWAQSYSIIDHQILHGRYLHRLSHESMILYLFLIVVGDRCGRSFYSDRSITEILRLSSQDLYHAREELISEGLINYHRPFWELNNLTERREHGRNHKADHPLSSRCPETELLSNSRSHRNPPETGLTHISRILSEKQGKEGFSLGSIPYSDRRVVQRAPHLKGPAGPSVVKDKGSQDQLPRSGQLYKRVP
jgi:hypothetical protein